MALSGLVCASVSARPSAPDEGAKTLDQLLLDQQRASCPLCATGTICNQHLF